MDQHRRERLQLDRVRAERRLARRRVRCSLVDGSRVLALGAGHDHRLPVVRMLGPARTARVLVAFVLSRSPLFRPPQYVLNLPEELTPKEW